MMQNEFRGANNRAYYAIYHIISAVHALDGKAYKRHKDALGNFNKEYIKNSLLGSLIPHRKKKDRDFLKIVK